MEVSKEIFFFPAFKWMLALSEHLKIFIKKTHKIYLHCIAFFLISIMRIWRHYVYYPYLISPKSVPAFLLQHLQPKLIFPPWTSYEK